MIGELVRAAIFLALVIGALLLFGGCATKAPPDATLVVDVYLTEEGFFVVTSKGLDDSLAIKFNAEVLRSDEPKEKYHDLDY